MIKKNIWKLEYSITIFVLLGLFMLFVPVKIENYYQASLISKWNERYNNVSYMFTVINAQTNDEILKSFAQAKTPEQREKLLLQLVKPYLRIKYTDKLSPVVKYDLDGDEICYILLTGDMVIPNEHYWQFEVEEDEQTEEDM